MQKVRLGKTELHVKPLSYGAIKLPKISEKEAAECLNRALDLGINYIDTARNYSDSEEKIGKALEDRRDEFYVATKTSARDAEKVKRELEISLTNLRTDHIDVHQLHTVSNQEAWDAVRADDGAYAAAVEAKDQGMVNHIGITIHRDKKVMRESIQSGMFETIMLCYSPVDAEDVAEEILPMAKDADMGTIIMKALSGGTLAYPKEDRKAGLGGEDAVVAGSLRFVMQNPNCDMVIPGMQAVHEVEENVAVAENFEPLTEDEERDLMSRIATLPGELRYGQTCLQCGYCMPCTVGINIPEVLKALRMKRSYDEGLDHVAEEIWSGLDTTPDECVQCGECEEKCPAGIDIMDRMEAAAELFGA